jgi:dCTP deaminase
MILTDKQILAEIKAKRIVIEPFRRECLGSNSYDVHLGKTLAVYQEDVLDCKKENAISYFDIADDGVLLLPTKLYLGVTLEYTESHAHVPFLEGKSSIGRLGIDIHATAGKGDIGYCNTWTLEISVRQPVRVYAGMPIGQLIYFEVSGETEVPYRAKKSAKYVRRTDKPIASMMYLNFDRSSNQWK